MAFNIKRQLRGYREKHRRRRIWRRAVTAMACVAVFCTTYALILPAITLGDNDNARSSDTGLTVGTIVQRAYTTLGPDGLNWLQSNGTAGTGNGAASNLTFNQNGSFWANSGVASGDRFNATTASNLSMNNIPVTNGTAPGSHDGRSIWRTVKYDNALGGWYREYHVYDANQLSKLLYMYRNSSNTLKASYSADAAGGFPSDGSAANKLAIVLENDLDLGGANGANWIGYYNHSVYLEIDGNGHTIYNGLFNGGERFLGKQTDSDRYFSIHDVTFSSMYIGGAQGLFGRSTYNAYFYNVNIENSLSIAGGTDGAILFGRGTENVWVKDCTIINCHSIGGHHTGMFASTMSNDAQANNAESNEGWGKDVTVDTYMIGAGDAEGKTQYYYGSIPKDGEYTSGGNPLSSIEAAEAKWKGGSVTKDDGTYKTYKLNSASRRTPNLFEGCGTIDCGLYVPYSNVAHSGGFVSCVQGMAIFRDCFSTTDCYCVNQCGVFTGSCIGVAVGFLYPDVCDDPACACDPTAVGSCEKCKTSVLTNIVFENCWTSGSLEGTSQMGGFTGNIFTTNSTEVIQSGQRGHAVFKNCYSTSAVGMEFSGEQVGGFAGDIIGNYSANNAEDGSEAIQHVLKNCYAAGEVGGITTDTAAGSTANTIGGFFGRYVNVKTVAKQNRENDDTFASNHAAEHSEVISGSTYNNVARMINCYYDKQTTAMRERDIGTVYRVGTSGAGTLTGLSGVYTQASDQKGVQGLTDSVNLNDLAAQGWVNEDEYYPMLAGTYHYSTAGKPAASGSNSSAVSQMYKDRQALYQYYALASAATVFLDHYDQILSDGNDVGLDGTTKIPAGTVGATGDKLVYDTVRDITRKFTFTSAYPGAATGNDVHNHLAWSTSSERNKASGFHDELEEFSLTWSGAGTGTDSTVTAHYSPNVATVYWDAAEGGGLWKCVDFAPGKTWVNVTVASTGINYDDTGHLDAVNGVAGTRYLRLLPSAYLNAGGIMSVEVEVTNEADGTQKTTNHVWTYVPDSSDTGTNGWRQENLSEFSHNVGVAYAITDRERQGADTIYGPNTVTDVSTNAAADTSGSFALAGKYLRDRDTQAVGLNGDTMYSQTFPYVINDANTSTQNLSTSGSTIVRVYETISEAVEESGEGRKVLQLTQGDEITAPEELAKFTGEELFEVTDAGYYFYMVYQWRLNDGRYLEDVKLVQVTSTAYTVTMATGIKDGQHTATAPIDQFVDDNRTQGVLINKDYPSDSIETVSEGNYDNADNGTGYKYNQYVDFSSAAYGMKSITRVQTGNYSAVGWKNTEDYRLVSVLFQVEDHSGWTTLSRYMPEDGEAAEAPFQDLYWQYHYTSYQATQDPEYKTFTILEVENSYKVLSVSSTGTDAANGGAEYTIDLSFDTPTSGGDGSAGGGQTVNSGAMRNLRVVALYEQLDEPSLVLKTDQSGSPVAGVTFTAHKANKNYNPIANGQEDSTLEVGVTDAAGQIYFRDKDGNYLDLDDLQQRLGDHFILEETETPEGYRGISTPAYLRIDHGRLVSDNPTDSGVSVQVRARITANETLYPVDYGTDESSVPITYYSPGDQSSVKGILFAVVMQKSSGAYQDWYPVYKNSDGTYGVYSQSGAAGVLAALGKEGITVAQVFQKYSSGTDAVFTGMETTLDLPGDVTKYEEYLTDANQSTDSAKYRVAYYYTEDEALSSNSTIVEVSGGVVPGSSGSETLSNGFTIVYGATIRVTNYDNRLYVQKLNEASEGVEDAVFALYKADSSWGSYTVTNADGTDTQITLSPDKDGVNQGTATVGGSSGTYAIDPETGVITVQADTGTYTINPVGLTTTENLTDPRLGAAGEFKNLPAGSYLLREIAAPAPYALNTAEVQVYVDADGVYANAGTEDDDGVAVKLDPGYLAPSLDHMTEQGIEYAMGKISAQLQTGDAVDNMSPVDGRLVELTYGESNRVFDYGATGYEPFKVESGWSKLTIISGQKEDENVTHLLSGAVIVAVTDQVKMDLTIEKIGQNTATKLSGAQFRLYYTEGGTNFYYTYTEGVGAQWVTANAEGSIPNAALLTTGDGTYQDIAIHDLTPGTYYLEEVDPPAGYHKLAEPVTITVTMKGGATHVTPDTVTVTMTYGDYTYSNNGANGGSPGWAVARQTADGTPTYAWTLTVPNSTGEELPETGGAGTGLLLAGGLGLMAAALLALWARRRREGPC